MAKFFRFLIVLQCILSFSLHEIISSVTSYQLFRYMHMFTQCVGQYTNVCACVVVYTQYLYNVHVFMCPHTPVHVYWYTCSPLYLCTIMSPTMPSIIITTSGLFLYRQSSIMHFIMPSFTSYTWFYHYVLIIYIL